MLMADTLFPVDSSQPCNTPAPGIPRVQFPVRNQIEIQMADLDSLVEDNHTVRLIWTYLLKADLSEMYGQIQAIEGGAGRPAIDPRILLALWMYAIADGVGSARKLAKLCEDHNAYRWICGGVSVNYHTLADFRSGCGELIDDLLTTHLAALRMAGVLTLKRVAHDGLRVRAAAGSGSFKRQETLLEHYQEAKEQVLALRQELHDDPAACDRRHKAARERAVREREERVAEALRQYPEVQAHKKKEKDKTRVSMTDPDARKMKMPDGGFRPAYNVQLSVETETQLIVDAELIQCGSDAGQLLPAAERIEARHGCKPQEILADGGFTSRSDIERLARAEPACTVFVPPPQYRDKSGQVLESRPDESAEVKAWREMMKQEEAKTIYKERAATVECANAQMRNRGMQQFRVRGWSKVRAVVLMFALVHNVLREVTLRRSRVPVANG
jgi:transposase